MGVINKLKNKKGAMIIGIILLIILIFVGINYINNVRDKNSVETNLEKLYEMEGQDTRVLEDRIAKFDNEKNKKTREKDFIKIFNGAVVVGDSITEALDEYRFLESDQTLYRRGASLSSKTDIRKKLYSMQPKVAFLTFGMNDLEIYGKDTKKFISAYESLLKDIRAKSPKTKIYINSVMPANKKKMKDVPKLKYYDDYNKALSKMCKNQGIPFIDNTKFILSNDYFEPDGQHFQAVFYPKWLNRMAAAAGLI